MDTIVKKLKSEKNALHEIEPILFDLKNSLNISEDKFYCLVVSVTEAVNNAIIHGNRCNSEKFIDFKISFDGSSLFISVRDEGDGFDVNEISDPRTPENLLKEGGRGVFLIKSLMTSSNFINTGNGSIIEMSLLIN